MVAQHAEPGLAVEARAVIHALEDLVELVVRRVGDLAHGRAAGLLDASPVEVVPDVQQILRVLEGGAAPQGGRHQLLRPVVDAGHVATARGAGWLAAGVEALDELAVRAELHVVHLVPARPGEDAGTGAPATAVRDDGWTALDGVERAVHAAPVANGEDVHRACAREGHRGPGPALVPQGPGGGAALDGVTVVRTAPALRRRGTAAVASAAGRLAATAGRAAAAVAAGRRAEVQPLEVLHGAPDVIDPRDGLHLPEPPCRVRVVPASGGGPGDDRTAAGILRRLQARAGRGAPCSLARGPKAGGALRCSLRCLHLQGAEGAPAVALARTRR
mmetsp:Transcript_61320/g.190532  ORF Transcript_61320/g.190532 Transcript_61320/m.190532 type:complete len:331 (-) Transcript_61320:257-1249(-)